MLKVAIVMGSDSDLNVVRPAADTLKSLGIPFEVRVISAHRTPEAAAAFSAGAREKGFGVIIAAAIFCGSTLITAIFLSSFATNGSVSSFKTVMDFSASSARSS